MMYKASMNIFAQVSFYTKFLFLLGKCLVEFLSHRVSLKFIKTEDFPILHSSVCGFRLFHVVIYFWYYLMFIALFDASTYNSYEMILNCSFNFHFLVTNDAEHLFICLLIIFISSFMEYLIK